MIRLATGGDLRALVELTRVYYKDHWFGGHTNYDADWTHEQFKGHIVSPQANVILKDDAEQGILGFSVAMVYPLQWTPQLRCTIAFSYIDEAHRNNGVYGALIDNHTLWAKKLNCVDINTGDGAQYKGKFGTVLLPLGFEHMGTDAYKVLQYE